MESNELQRNIFQDRTTDDKEYKQFSEQPPFLILLPSFFFKRKNNIIQSKKRNIKMTF